jgi:hypothetical protein
MMTRTAPVLFLRAAAFAACVDRTRTPVVDGFEAQSLGAHWETKRFVPGAVQIQSQVVRAGQRAARITLSPGDQIPQERGTKLERAELQEPRSLWAREGSSARYYFKVGLYRDRMPQPMTIYVDEYRKEPA